MTTPNIKKPSAHTTPDLKSFAMKFAKTNRSDPYDRQVYTKIVRVLASRLKADPKKIRRQARDQHWAN